MQISESLEDPNFVSKAVGLRTIYTWNGHILSAKKLIKKDIPELKEAIIRNVPIILKAMQAIRQMIYDIPSEYNGFIICSNSRKEFYFKGMEARLSELLLPEYNRITGANLIYEQLKDSGSRTAVEILNNIKLN